MSDHHQQYSQKSNAKDQQGQIVQETVHPSSHSTINTADQYSQQTNRFIDRLVSQLTLIGTSTGQLSIDDRNTDAHPQDDLFTDVFQLYDKQRKKLQHEIGVELSSTDQGNDSTKTMLSLPSIMSDAMNASWTTFDSSASSSTSDQPVTTTTTLGCVDLNCPTCRCYSIDNIQFQGQPNNPTYRVYDQCDASVTHNYASDNRVIYNSNFYTNPANTNGVQDELSNTANTAINNFQDDFSNGYTPQDNRYWQPVVTGYRSSGYTTDSPNKNQTIPGDSLYVEPVINNGIHHDVADYIKIATTSNNYSHEMNNNIVQDNVTEHCDSQYVFNPDFSNNSYHDAFTRQRHFKPSFHGKTNRVYTKHYTGQIDIGDKGTMTVPFDQPNIFGNVNTDRYRDCAVNRYQNNGIISVHPSVNHAYYQNPVTFNNKLQASRIETNITINVHTNLINHALHEQLASSFNNSAYATSNNDSRHVIVKNEAMMHDHVIGASVDQFGHPVANVYQNTANSTDRLILNGQPIDATLNVPLTASGNRTSTIPNQHTTNAQQKEPHSLNVASVSRTIPQRQARNRRRNQPLKSNASTRRTDIARLVEKLPPIEAWQIVTEFHRVSSLLQQRDQCNRNNTSIELWQFLLEELIDPTKRCDISWTGVGADFKLINPDDVSKRWGERKRRPRMNYEKLSRGLRYYYLKMTIVKVPNQRYVYCFTHKVLALINKLLSNDRRGSSSPSSSDLMDHDWSDLSDVA